VSPEWRGLLKRDYSFSYVASRSLYQYRGWASLEGGYTWRDGAPADQLYFTGDTGYPLPFAGALLKMGGSAIFPFGSKKQWSAEIGYNQWMWGRSARRYKEPFISVGRSF
jgi:hypothetical protein